MTLISISEQLILFLLSEAYLRLKQQGNVDFEFLQSSSTLQPFFRALLEKQKEQSQEKQVLKESQQAAISAVAQKIRVILLPVDQELERLIEHTAASVAASPKL